MIAASEGWTARFRLAGADHVHYPDDQPVVVWREDDDGHVDGLLPDVDGRLITPAQYVYELERARQAGVRGTYVFDGYYQERLLPATGGWWAVWYEDAAETSPRRYWPSCTVVRTASTARCWSPAPVATAGWS